VKPLLLDLFCGAGGAAEGYSRAGFDIVGVDLFPQPDYPFRFVQGDALEYLVTAGYDAVHASPPCQASSTLIKGTWGGLSAHIDQVPTVRRLLAALDVPTVVENVKSADLRPDLTLCGTMFGLPIYRHRYFQLSFPVPRPPHPVHRGRINGWRHGRYFKGSFVSVYGNGGSRGDVEAWQQALDCPWITSKRSLAQAIPPAYTAHIGAAMLAAL
jgi:hypothetical protein